MGKHERRTYYDYLHETAPHLLSRAEKELLKRLLQEELAFSDVERKNLDSYIGRTVVLIRDCETFGGRKYPEGREFLIENRHGKWLCSRYGGTLIYLSPKWVRKVPSVLSRSSPANRPRRDETNSAQQSIF